MHHCQHSSPLTTAEYEALPDKDGIIPDCAMEAFECGRPTGIKHHGMWLCASHCDAVCQVSVRPHRLAQLLDFAFAS
jgi:hypothetical protein